MEPPLYVSVNIIQCVSEKVNVAWCMKMSVCDIDCMIFADTVDNAAENRYNRITMIVKSIFNVGESYTHEDWVYRDLNVGFSRLYYILDGEGGYEEDGRAVRLKKGCLYLTPVHRRFSLYDNENNKMLHTYTHIYTVPTVQSFLEFEVTENTPIADAVGLWRKYIDTEDVDLVANAVQFLLSCLNLNKEKRRTAAELTRQYLDGQELWNMDMEQLSREIGYSREHITRSFLNTYHTTPKQYLQTKRMNAALEYLLRGEKICDISEMIGYQSTYAFSKAFKKYFGLSPEPYIKTLGLISPSDMAAERWKIQEMEKIKHGVISKISKNY